MCLIGERSVTAGMLCHNSSLGGQKWAVLVREGREGGGEKKLEAGVTPDVSGCGAIKRRKCCGTKYSPKPLLVRGR